MVNMLAVDPSLKIRTVAGRVAEGMEGDSSRNAETLRKRYRRLNKLGQLPPPQNLDALRVSTILDLYKRRNAWLEDSKRELAEAEKEALRLKLDISLAGLPALIRNLELERDSISQLLHARPDFAFVRLLQQGIKADQVETYLSEASGKIRQLEERLQLVRRISDLREQIPS